MNNYVDNKIVFCEWIHYAEVNSDDLTRLCQLIILCMFVELIVMKLSVLVL